MRKKVVVSAPYLQLEWEKHKDSLKEFEIIMPPVLERFEEEDMLKILSHDVEGIICGDDRITEKVIDAAKSLKTIVKWGTGIDSINKKYAESKGIKVLNTPEAFIVPVTESTIGMMLSIIRKIDENNRLMHEGRWQKIRASTLSESTVGILGYGRIGSHVAERLSHFTENIIWHDIKSDEELKPGGTFFGTRVDLSTLVAESDIISIHCDLNSTSYHLINEQNISMMKDGVIIINTARGAILNEKDIERNLKKGKIGFVGLDVFETEPLPENSYFRNSDRSIILSHNSNSSSYYWEKVHINSIKLLIESINR